jgi:hypothetical protein
VLQKKLGYSMQHRASFSRACCKRFFEVRDEIAVLQNALLALISQRDQYSKKMKSVLIQTTEF